MVVIHGKGKSEEHQFLYETTVAVPVSQLVKELVTYARDSGSSA